MATSEEVIVSRAGGLRWPTYPTTIVRFPCVRCYSRVLSARSACEHASVGSRSAYARRFSSRNSRACVVKSTRESSCHERPCRGAQGQRNDNPLPSAPPTRSLATPAPLTPALDFITVSYLERCNLPCMRVVAWWDDVRCAFWF